MRPALFRPLDLRSVRLPNRIVLSPMCQYSAVHGVPNRWHDVHLGRYAAAGLGAVTTEATHVSARARITPGCTGLWNAAQRDAFARIVAFHKGLSSAPIGIQLGHAGRKASTAAPWDGGEPLTEGAWRTESASATPVAEGRPIPEALDAAGLARVKREFVKSTRLAAEAGFDFVELHAAHGYLLHQFLSPVSNKRNDGYGGDRTGRMRFPLDVFAAMRAAFPTDKPFGVRVSATDWLGPNAWDVEDTVAFAAELKALGCDFVDVSSGGISPAQKVATGPGYQVPFAAEVKRRVGLPTIAVGLITDPRQAEAIVAEGAADAVALARGLLNDPFWAWRAAETLGAEVAIPNPYLRGRRMGADPPRELRPPASAR
jgi:2,4-dienoyl-CoA reductase-like NADH-dependent reductase (Old Yellow Enzyme family)